MHLTKHLAIFFILQYHNMAKGWWNKQDRDNTFCHRLKILKRKSEYERTFKMVYN